MIAPTSFFSDYGCHVRILEEARSLQQLGHRVTIVTYRNGRNVPDLDIQRTLPIPWRQHYEVGSSRHKVVFDALLGLKTLQLMATRRFDVIHAHLHEGALIGLVLGRLFGLPVVFDFQGSLTEEMIDHHFLQRNGKIHGLLRKLEVWIDHTAPLILTSTHNAERILVEQFGSNPLRIRSLPDCVNIDEFRPATQFDPTELAALRSRLGIPKGARVIVYLGLLAEYQGTPHLLRAMQNLRRRHNDVYLLLMGFPAVEYYQRMAQELGIQDRVIFTGRVLYEQAAHHLALGDVAVSPKLSQTEGAGKLLNYMAMGLPTVAFDTLVAHEYLGLAGLYAEPGNVDSLSSLLESVLTDRQMGEHLGRQLRQRAVEHFQWRRAAAQLEAAYTALCAIPSASQMTQHFQSHQK
ncbi:MAG TPA: glycosyltransferase family 1 protein [Chloroflexi bacterium]|nr:glycosyltransferase family 1 protein [Chloroflexota bacterium]HHW88223.1 glycosyltransferase family 4 protein [Chloroflexota bacterium]